MPETNRRVFLKRAGAGMTGIIASGVASPADAVKSTARQSPSTAGGRGLGRASAYRVAVIGRTGRGNYGHGLDVVWKDVEKATVAAVADEDEQGRRDAAKRLNVQNAYADYREMIERERPDIVAVAPRWLDCHRDMVLAAVEHGCHIYLEKPMSQTLAQADEMVAAVQGKSTKLAMALQTRYSPRMDRVMELIREGRLGDILEMRGRGKEDHRGGGEDLMVLGTHVLDMMRVVAGDPIWCFARVLEKGRPVTKAEVRDGNEGIGPLAGDEIVASYGFNSPTVGHFGTHRAKHGQAARFGLNIYGTKGVVTLTTGSLPHAHFIEDPGWAPGRSTAKWIEISSAGLGKPEPLADQGLHLGNIRACEDLIRAIETDAQPRASVYDARAALEMVLAVYESHRLDAPVTLPMKNRKHPLQMM